MSAALKERINQIKQRNAAAAAPAAVAASPATPKAPAPAPARKAANSAPAAATSASSTSTNTPPSPAPAKASAPAKPTGHRAKITASAPPAAPASAEPAAAPAAPAAPAAAPPKVPAKSKKVAQNAAPVEETNDAGDSENIALASGLSRRSAAARNKKTAAAASTAAAAAPEAVSEQAQEPAEEAVAAAPEPVKKQRRKAYVAEQQEEVVAAAAADSTAQEDAAEEEEDEQEEDDDAPKKKARKPRKKSEGPTKGAIKRGKRKVNDTERAIDDYVEALAKLPADELPAYVSTFFEKSFNVKKATNDVNIGPEVSVSDHTALLAMALDGILDAETRGAKSITKQATNLFEPALEFARTGDYVEGSKRKLNSAYTKYSGQAAEASEYLNLLGDRTLQFNLRRNGNNRIIASPGVAASLNSVRMNVLPQYLEQLQTWGAECLTPEIRNQYTHRILSQNAWKTLGDVANQIQNNAARDANQGALQDLQDLFLFVAAGGSLADIDLEYSDRSTKKKAASTGNPNKRRKLE